MVVQPPTDRSSAPLARVTGGLRRVIPIGLRRGERAKFGPDHIAQGQPQLVAILVDFAIDFVKSNGKTSRKVFKLKNIRLQPMEAVHFKKSFSFKKISTRQYYAGSHQLSILVNGNEVASQAFMLTTP